MVVAAEEEEALALVTCSVSYRITISKMEDQMPLGWESNRVESVKLLQQNSRHDNRAYMYFGWRMLPH